MMHLKTLIWASRYVFGISYGKYNKLFLLCRLVFLIGNGYDGTWYKGGYSTSDLASLEHQSYLKVLCEWSRFEWVLIRG
jgi:hypothetical protein